MKISMKQNEVTMQCLTLQANFGQTRSDQVSLLYRRLPNNGDGYDLYDPEFQFLVPEIINGRKITKILRRIACDSVEMRWLENGKVTSLNPKKLSRWIHWLAEEAQIDRA